MERETRTRATDRVDRSRSLRRPRPTRRRLRLACPQLVPAVLLLWAGTTPAAGGGSGGIEGTLVGPGGGGLGGVEVVLVDAGRSELTGPDGAFEFADVASGAWDLLFAAGERTHLETGVEVHDDRSTPLRVEVDWQLVLSETITVRAASRRPERITEAPAAISRLTREEIERRSTHGQLPRLLGTLPGAETAQADLYEFNLNTRGFNSIVNRRILTLIDGRDPSLPGVGSQEWAALAFALDELESAELVRGPGSALYGAGAYNGVVDLRTRSPIDFPGGALRLTGGELDTARVDGRWAGALGADWHGKAVGGGQRSGDFTESRVERAEYRPDLLPLDVVPPPLDDVEIVFGSLRADRDVATGTLMALELGSALVEGTTTLTGLGRVQQLDSRRPWARLHLGAPHWNLLASYTAQDSRDITPLSSGAKLFWDTRHVAVELQAHSGFADGRGRVVGGASYGEHRLDSADRTGSQTQLVRPVTQERRSVYAQADLDLLPGLKGVLTGRWDDSNLWDGRFSPRAALVWQVGAGRSLRLSYSEGFQGPSVVEQFLRVPAGPPIDLSALEGSLAPILDGVPLHFRDVPLLVVGNPDLEVEEVRGVELGFLGPLDSRTMLTVAAYRNELDNFTTDLLPQVGTSLGRLNADFGPYRPPNALSDTAADLVLESLEAALGPALLAVMSNDESGLPVFVPVSIGEAGRVDTQGLEIGIFRAQGPWRAELSYTWFDFTIRDEAPENRLSPNVPEHRLGLRVGRVGERTDASLGVRWSDGFEWMTGIFVGPVPSYTVVDLSWNLRLDESWSVGIDVDNLLDDAHWEVFGGNLLRRRALAYLAVDF